MNSFGNHIRYLKNFNRSIDNFIEMRERNMYQDFDYESFIKEMEEYNTTMRTLHIQFPQLEMIFFDEIFIAEFRKLYWQYFDYSLFKYWIYILFLPLHLIFDLVYKKENKFIKKISNFRIKIQRIILHLEEQ